MTASRNTSTNKISKMAARRVARKSRVSRKRRKAARKAATPKAPRRRVTRKRRSSKRRATRRRVARKAKKAKKPKTVGKKWQVWKGTRVKTVGGLTKKDLMLNKSGKVVSKKKSMLTKKRKGGITNWCAAVKQARKEMSLTGFVACKKGTAFYKRVNGIYKAM